MKPRLLDLFCGAGGAAMGYHRAGFEVVGVDWNPQPHYPFEFHQADAMAMVQDVLNGCWHEGTETALPGRLAACLGHFDAIHASPPCQAYTVANNIHQNEHPDLLPATRERLEATGLPWVIENVPGAPMYRGPGSLFEPGRHGVLVCGLALGCNVKRHRWFESNIPLRGTECPPGHPGDWLLVFGHTVLERGHTIGIAKGGGPRIKRKHTTTERGRDAMGIDWMNRDELSEAVPPSYTTFIGEQLLASLPAVSGEARSE